MDPKRRQVIAVSAATLVLLVLALTLASTRSTIGAEAAPAFRSADGSAPAQGTELASEAPPGRVSIGRPGSTALSIASSTRKPVIAGRVVDLNGRGVAGLSVVFEAATDSGFDTMPEGNQSTSTDDGSFILPSPGRSGRLAVASDHFVGLYSPPWFGPEPPREVLLVVSPPCSLSGIVTDAGDAAMPGVEITLRLVAGSDFPLPFELPPWGLALWRGRSDADGRFLEDRVPCLPSALVEFKKEGYPLTRLDLPSFRWTDIGVRLGARNSGAVAVHGTVYDTAGLPIEAANVGGGGAVAKTGLDGRFEVLCSGTRVPITAVKMGYAPAVEWVDVSDPGPKGEVSLVLPDSLYFISGRIVDLGGNVIPGAAVALLTESPLGRVRQTLGAIEFERQVSAEDLLSGSAGGGPRPRWVLADEGGRFKLINITGREYDLLLLDPRTLARRVVRGVRAGTSEKTFVLQQDVARVVGGQVVNFSGDPIEGIQVSLRLRVNGRDSLRLPPSGPFKCLTDSTGSFELGPVVTTDTVLGTAGTAQIGAGNIDLELENDVNHLRIQVEERIQLQAVVQAGGLKVDTIAVEDESGNRIPLSYDYMGATLVTSTAPFVGLQTSVITTSARARSIVVLLDGEEVGRVSVWLRSGKTNKVEF